MKTVGFPISRKENEKRRCLIPEHIKYVINYGQLFIESGYGDVLGYSDSDYEIHGVRAISREEVLKKDVIVDPKIGDAEYLKELYNQIIFGWVHAVQNREITDILLEKKLTAIAWEDMNKDGRHVFWRNNEIAGEAAIMHAYTLFGVFPYNTKVAILGRGNIGRGALKVLTFMGADVTVYDRKTEQLFVKELPKYDVVVNAILWDTTRKDHIVNKSDLLRMKRGAMIIDISCDRNGAIETSYPTTINEPIYYVDGICHYVVDHTPSLFYKTISHNLSEIMAEVLDQIIEERYSNVLQNALIVKDGVIIDQRISDFQNR